MRILLLLLFLSPLIASAQEKDQLPYKELPKYAESYQPGDIIARMVDGLGYRFYWATEGLTKTDLEYKISEDGRSTLETVKHIFDLSKMVLNSTQKIPNERSSEADSMTFDQLRAKTLMNLKAASENLKGKNADEIAELSVKFIRGDNIREYPFWHMLNGPISDGLYHTGQVVTFRRASGNPMNSKVNVFMGKNNN